MENWIDEFLLITTQSKKIVVVAVLGGVFFIGIHLIGHFSLIDFQLHGPLTGIKEVLKEILFERYSATAFFALISFWSLAIKLYLKERKRLFS